LIFGGTETLGHCISSRLFALPLREDPKTARRAPSRGWVYRHRSRRWSGDGRQFSRPLSQREREIVALLAGGASDAQIAGRLFLSANTVRSHLERTRDKTGARRRAELVRYAIQAGIDPVTPST
jgi:DNA-binding CsgD family transcriptional regulator